MNYQTISESIVESLKSITKQNFCMNGCKIRIPYNVVKKILYYDDNTLAEFHVDRGKIFTRINLSSISNYAHLEIIFEGGSVRIGRGGVFHPN